MEKLQLVVTLIIAFIFAFLLLYETPRRKERRIKTERKYRVYELSEEGEYKYRYLFTAGGKYFEYKSNVMYTSIFDIAQNCSSIRITDDSTMLKEGAKMITLRNEDEALIVPLSEVRVNISAKEEME